MTTIIVDVAQKRLVADSLAHYLNQSFKTPKLHRIKSSIYGAAGNLEHITLFWDWVRNGTDVDFSDEPEFEIIELNASGAYLYLNSLSRYELSEPFFAVGSGGTYALGAMSMGATPEKAIEIASRWDPATRLPLETMYLSPNKGRKKKEV